MSYFGGKPIWYNYCYNYDHVIRSYPKTFTTFIEDGESLGLFCQSKQAYRQ